ncbi:MAG: hypothetical protein LC635_04230 [Pseudonocardiaceae bacterium]|nr:hypothetical protein [Pseudonocardiaceae bacterium]
MTGTHLSRLAAGPGRVLRNVDNGRKVPGLGGGEEQTHEETEDNLSI